MLFNSWAGLGRVLLVGTFACAALVLLLHRGRLLERAMQAERITREEILAALRASGAAEGGEIAAARPTARSACSPRPGRWAAARRSQFWTGSTAAAV